MYALQNADPHFHVHLALSDARLNGADQAIIEIHQDHITVVDNRPDVLMSQTRTWLRIKTFRPPDSVWQLIETLSAHPAPTGLKTALELMTGGPTTCRRELRNLHDSVALDLPDEECYLTLANGLAPITIVAPNGTSMPALPYGYNIRPEIHRTENWTPNQPVNTTAYALVHTPDREPGWPPDIRTLARLHSRLAAAVLSLARTEAEAGLAAWPAHSALELAQLQPQYLHIPVDREYIRPELEKIDTPPRTARRLDDPSQLRLMPENACVPIFPKSHEQELIRIVEQRMGLTPVTTEDKKTQQVSLAGVTTIDHRGRETRHPACSENDPQWPGHFPPVTTAHSARTTRYTFRAREPGGSPAKDIEVEVTGDGTT